MNKFVKYLLCILFSILAINFLVNLISFFYNTEAYLTPAKITANPTSENLISSATELENQLDSLITDLKEQNGEDYPALGIMYYRTIAHYSSVTIIQNFIFQNFSFSSSFLHCASSFLHKKNKNPVIFSDDGIFYFPVLFP